MVNGVATLVVDLGNSSTRIKTYFGKNAKGESRSHLSILDNRFGEIPQNKLPVYLEGDVYDADESRVFTYNDKVYCNGIMCNTEFSSMAIRPTALEKKYESLVTKLTLINALCQGYLDVADFADTTLDQLDISWNIALELPPDDIDVGAKKLAELVRSIDEVYFLMPELSKKINVESVKIYPEGFCALIAVLFEKPGVLRDGYRHLLEADTRTLVCDIGAGTTDFVMAEGCNVVSSTRFTREIGGNNVHQRVRRLLKDANLALSDRIVRQGCETGFVKSGAKTFDIRKYIAKAKDDVSKQLVDAVQEFFEDSMIPVKSINNILICGGGAEDAGVEGIEPISRYIVDYMTRLSADIALVELPIVTVNGQKNRVSPRLLNVLGAGILAEQQ